VCGITDSGTTFQFFGFVASGNSQLILKIGLVLFLFFSLETRLPTFFIIKAFFTATLILAVHFTFPF